MYDPEPVVEILTAEEYAAAIESTLEHLGYTREQLADFAARRDFPEPCAFMAWQLVREDRRDA